MAGCSVFVYDHEKFVPSELLKVLADNKVTSFCAPPTVFRFLIREDFTPYDLSSLKYCTTAGEALSPSVFETFHERTGLRLMEAFGQTETTVQLGTFVWMTPKPGSMGKGLLRLFIKLSCTNPMAHFMKMVNRSDCD